MPALPKKQSDFSSLLWKCLFCTMRCCLMKTWGLSPCRVEGAWGGHTPTQSTADRVKGELWGGVLPPFSHHMRDWEDSHPIPTCPMLAKRTQRLPTAGSRAKLSSWIQSKASEQQSQLHGHNCLDMGCLLEAEIMMAFKANMLGTEGAGTGGKGPRNQ